MEQSVSRAIAGIEAIVAFVEDDLGLAPLRSYVQALARSLSRDRKSAAVINRELLDWLAGRAQTERPFFAFLNYFVSNGERGRNNSCESAPDRNRSVSVKWLTADRFGRRMG
jgi:hypothetical protein